MQRLFGVPVVPTGTDSALEGNRYQCDYCREPYAQLGRFPMFNARTGQWCRSFCTPECAASFNRHVFHGGPTGHAALEQRYGRRIQWGPAPGELGIPRAMWLPGCREQLDESELQVVAREMVIADLPRSTIHKKK